MKESENFPSEIQKHFYSLAPFIQETIMQSGVQVQSVEQLDRLAEDIANAHKSEKRPES